VRQLVWVQWDDAAFRESGWHATDAVDAGYTIRTESSGFFVKEDAKGIVLAVDYDPEQGKWRGLTFIPHGMIRKKKFFKVT
jgi:hypothetical protein